MSTTERAPQAPTKMRAFFVRHGVATYYLLAIIISWVGVLLVLGGTGIPATPQESEELGGSAYMPMLLGPVLAGLLLIWLSNGRAGLRDLRSRLTRWQVGARWWVVAVFAIPLTAIATLLPMWAFSSEMKPEIIATDQNRAAFVVMGLLGGLLVGVIEEIGWTGFAIPRVRQRHGIVATGLTVGFMWGVWHLLLFTWNSGDETGAFDLSLLVPSFLFCLLVAPLIRVLMVTVYERTKSVLVAAVMHASFTGVVAMILIPLDAKGWPLTIWYLVFGAAMALVTFVVLRQAAKAGHEPGDIVVPDTPEELLESV